MLSAAVWNVLTTSVRFAGAATIVEHLVLSLTGIDREAGCLDTVAQPAQNFGRGQMF